MGHGKGVSSGYTDPDFGFIGDRHNEIIYGASTVKSLTLSIMNGKLVGLPEMVSGALLVTQGI